MNETKLDKSPDSIKKDKVPYVQTKSKEQCKAEIIAKHRQTRAKAGKQYSGKELYTGK